MRGHVQHGPIEQLNDLIDGGAMTPGAVEGITGIDRGRVEALLEQPPSHRGIETSSSLSVDETARISQLAAALACGAEIEAAARIRAVSELLTIALELSPAMLARLLRVDADRIVIALRDPALLSATEKLPLALRGQWLISVLNLAMPA